MPEVQIHAEDRIAASRHLSAFLLNALEGALAENAALRRELSAVIEVPVSGNGAHAPPAPAR